MNILRRLFERRDASTDPSWNALINRGALSASGQFVDARSAEGISTVFGCVQALSESTATLPLHLYQRLDNGDRQRADDYPLARVLRQPTEILTGFAFREMMTATVLLHGNAWARIDRNGAGEVIGLEPIHPRSVTVVRLPNGRYRFDVTMPDGSVSRFLQDELFHLADRTEPESILGKSRIQVARDTLGLALAQREHGSSVFRNGAMPSGVLETPHVMDTAQMQRIADSWRDRFAGVGNAGKTPVLEHGMQYKPVSMNLEDAQWVAAQQFSTEEICRMFRVPPTIVGDLRHGNYSNTAELGGQFVRYSLARHIAMWETSISSQLLGPIARRRYHAEHSVEGLLRGNPEARADFYGKAIKDGWMTVDEVRQLENLPKLDRENGDAV